MKSHGFVTLIADSLAYHRSRDRDITKLAMSVLFYTEIRDEITTHSVPDWSEGLGMRVKMLLGIPIDIIEADVEGMWYTMEIT